MPQSNTSTYHPLVKMDQKRTRTENILLHTGKYSANAGQLRQHSYTIFYTIKRLCNKWFINKIHWKDSDAMRDVYEHRNQRSARED